MIEHMSDTSSDHGEGGRDRFFPGFEGKFRPVRASQGAGRELETFELITERQKMLDEQYKNRDTSKNKGNTQVDLAVTIRDIDYIDPVDGSFRCGFEVHGIYTFDMDKQKRIRGLIYQSTAVDANAAAKDTSSLPLEEREFEEAMRDVGLQYRNALDNNIFYKLFWEKTASGEKVTRAPDMCHIRGKRTRYRQYTLDGEETALFMKYYNVPIIEINNVKQKLVGESIDWAKGVVVTLYEEVGANFDTHGTVSVMVARAYEYYLKEQFELQMFPFDFQDLSLELAIDETETMRGGSFDFTVNDIRFRKAALEDPEWVILEPNVMWYNPCLSEINLRARRQYKYYLLNVVLIMFILTSLGLTSYALDHDALGDRLNVNITLILTVVAFKFVLASYVPRTPYSTQLDVYMLLSTITLGMNCLGVLVGEEVAGYLGEERGREIDTLVFYSFALWIVSYTLLWLLYSLAMMLWSPGNKESRAIEFDLRKDSDEMYDFTVSYFEDASYGVQPRLRERVVSALRSAVDRSETEVSEKMMELLLSVGEAMVTAEVVSMLKKFLHPIEDAILRGVPTDAEARERFERADDMLDAWEALLEERGTKEYFQIGIVQKRNDDVIEMPSLALKMEAAGRANNDKAGVLLLSEM